MAAAARASLERAFAGGAMLTGIKLADRPTHHLAHKLIGGQLARWLVSHAGSIAQHSDAVGYLQHFVEPVRDIKDRRSFFPQPAEMLLEPRDLRLGETGRGLVEDQQPAASRDGPHDGQLLPLGGRQVIQCRGRAQLQAEPS